MSLRTLVSPSAGFSASGNHYACPKSHSAEAYWVLKKWRTKYFSATISLVLWWVNRLLQSPNPTARGFMPSKGPKNPPTLAYDPPSRRVRKLQHPDCASPFSWRILVSIANCDKDPSGLTTPSRLHSLNGTFLPSSSSHKQHPTIPLMSLSHSVPVHPFSAGFSVPCRAGLPPSAGWRAMHTSGPPLVANPASLERAHPYDAHHSHRAH